MSGEMSWRALWAETAGRLVAAEVGLDAGAAQTEARWLCEEASGIEHTDWFAECDGPATVRTVAALDAMVARRLAGEPIAYVLGSWSFRTLEVMVDARVLIPRSDTEMLVEVALSLARATHHRARGPLVVADLGTGSGVVGLSLAAELPLEAVEVWATDVSEEALAVARANLAGIGRRGAQVRLAAGSWWEALPHELEGRLDLVVSNPPYVAERELDELDESVRRWEPHGALVAGAEGLDAIAVLVEGARSWLGPGGWLTVEIGASQGNAAAALAERAGLGAVEIRRDLAGRDRVLLARRPGG